MELSNLFNLQFMMFAEMFCGYFICKKGILHPKDRSIVTKLVINLLLPANIISAFSLELNAEVLSRFLQILLVSIVVQIFCSILANTCFNKVRKETKPIMQYATICSNAGFLGNAVAEGVYGAEGLMFAQIYLIPQRIVMWTAGVSCFAKNGNNKDVWKTIVTHPCIIAVALGILRMVTGIPLPAAITSTLSSLGKCATPLIMVFLGMVLAEVGFSKMLSKDNLVLCFIRLFVIPVAVLIGCLLVHLDPLVTALSTVLAAMPAGTTTAVLAEQYKADVEFAANCVILSTILSIAILPLWVIGLNALL